MSGSFQAFDQGYLIDALAALGPTFAGVTQIPSDTPDDDIRALHDAGVRAVRFNIARGGSADLDGLETLARRVHDLERIAQSPSPEQVSAVFRDNAAESLPRVRALICRNGQTAATGVCDDGGEHDRASSEQEPVMTAPRRALIVIDAQQEYFDGLLPIQHPPREQSLARIRSTIEAAESADIPVVLVQHELPEGAPIFASRSATVGNHPEIAAFEDRAAKRVSKQFSSVFAQTGLAEWLREQDVDTVTLVGYMTNNCVIGSAVGAEPLGFAVEVLSDATGAIDIANGAGRASAQQVHETLMPLLHSNWAAVADTDAWIAAIQAGQALGKSDLVTSAANGRADG